MAVEVALNTPLAEALTNAVQAKLMDTGWASGGLDDSALGEYIILMLVNGKTQQQIAAELSADLLSLPPEDTGPAEFSRWLFEQVESLNRGLSGSDPAQVQQEFSTSENQGTAIRGAATRQQEEDNDLDADMQETMDEGQDGNIPTGPKSMRNRPANGIGNRRMMGQVNKAMDRTSDSILHRVQRHQGTERVNMHNRPPPKGPRSDSGRPNRFQQSARPPGINNLPNNGTPNSMMQMNPQQQMQLMAMLEQQAQMMAQFMPQQMQNIGQGMNPAFQNGGQQPGKSLFDRVEGNPRRPNGHHQRSNNGFNSRNGISQVNPADAVADPSESMEMELSQQTENPSESVCKFNLKCTKKDCPYAHQSPAAPPGTTIDLQDVCPFGAACKNKKCVGRHPSPFQKVAHASEQDCKFFPNCTNPKCPFRHPTMPMCRNGADCNREDCKFTHVRIMCKYNPCLNPDCVYKHAEGQKRGKYGDKVWTAEQDATHVSERKFIDEQMGDEELIRGENGMEAQGPGDSPRSPEVVT